MADTLTRKVEIILPAETADRLDAYAKASNSPLDNAASRALNVGLDTMAGHWPSLFGKPARTIAADTLITDAMIEAGWAARHWTGKVTKRELPSIYLAMQAARTIDDAPAARDDVVYPELNRLEDRVAEAIEDAMPSGVLAAPSQLLRMAKAAIAALSSQPSQDGEAMRWHLNDGSAPHACHVLAARFDDSFGEWIYGVVMSPPTKPFTHWRPLPEPPSAALSPKKPK